MRPAEECARECIVAICAIEPPDAQKSADLITALLQKAVEEERRRCRPALETAYGALVLNCPEGCTCGHEHRCEGCIKRGAAKGLRESLRSRGGGEGATRGEKEGG